MILWFIVYHIARGHVIIDSEHLYKYILNDLVITDSDTKERITHAPKLMAISNQHSGLTLFVDVYKVLNS